MFAFVTRTVRFFQDVRIDDYQRKLEEHWARQAEQRRIEQELADRMAAELTGFKRLLQAASRWHQAEFLRQYLTALEQSGRSADPSVDEITGQQTDSPSPSATPIPERNAPKEAAKKAAKKRALRNTNVPVEFRIFVGQCRHSTKGRSSWHLRGELG